MKDIFTNKFKSHFISIRTSLVKTLAGNIIKEFVDFMIICLLLMSCKYNCSRVAFLVIFSN